MGTKAKYYYLKFFRVMQAKYNSINITGHWQKREVSSTAFEMYMFTYN